MSVETISEVALSNEILRVEVGSTLHGTGEEGQEDLDLMGISIGTPSTVLGMGQFEHYTWRTQPEGHRSGPGDTDLVIYELRKYLRMAMQGNPSVLLPLFVWRPEHIYIRNEIGEQLQALAPDIISKRAGYRFLGYLDAQLGRMLGTKNGHKPNRPELIERFGYDTKYAMHATRLGLQGVELMRSGILHLPMLDAPRGLCKGIRSGKFTFDESIQIIEQVRESLIQAIELTDLPDEPNEQKVEEFIMNAYLEHWRNNGALRLQVLP
jgi:hypothetical protein